MMRRPAAMKLPQLAPHPTAAMLYLDLLKGTLTRTAMPEQFVPFNSPDSRSERLIKLARRVLNEPQLTFAKAHRL